MLLRCYGPALCATIWLGALIVGVEPISTLGPFATGLTISLFFYIHEIRERLRYGPPHRREPR